MTDARLLGKFIFLIGAFSTFLVLSTGVAVPGWSDFVATVSTNPFANIPQWPTFGQPASNTTVDNLYLRDAGYVPFEDDDLVCTTTKELSVDAGSAPLQIVAIERACWTFPLSENFFEAGLWRTYLNVSGTAGDMYRHVLWNFDSDNTQWFPESRCVEDVTLGPPGIHQTSCTLESWTFASNRVLTLQIQAFESNEDPITVRYENGTTDSRIDPPTWSQSAGSECSWNPVTWAGCVSGTIDWIGTALLYIGGVIWVMLNYLGLFFAWLIAIFVSFFVGMISMGAFLAGGAGVPSPASYLFQIVFISFLGVVFYTILALIMGRVSAT